jgi:uncharacterized SAM-binding protein YcdF (DUF218 family)
LRTTLGVTSEVIADAKVLWDYHRLGLPYGSADLILGLGSFDPAVAEHAAALFLGGRAKWLMFTGGLVDRQDLLKPPWPAPEAQVFRQIALTRGVSESAILMESRSENTGDNFRFSLALLRERVIPVETMIIVTKPYVERRARATARKELGSIGFAVTSPPCSFEEYCFERFEPARIINLMVGDLQRIAVYPARGFQTDETIPDDVWHAYDRLIAAGYTQHLLHDASGAAVPPRSRE